MNTENPALAKADQLRAVATLLTQAADNYIAWLKESAPDLDSGEVYARLQEDFQLRSLSNQMYFEASNLTLSVAIAEQQELEKAIGDANAKLEAFQDYATTLDLVSDLIALAAAILTGKPNLIFAALKEVWSDVEA